MSYKYNIDIVGNLTNNNGILSGFSSSNYATIPVTFNPGTSDFEIVIYGKVTDTSNTGYILAGNSNSTIAIEFGGGVWMSVNGGTYNLRVNGSGYPDITQGYYRKFSRIGNTWYNHYSIDGENWIQTGSATNSGSSNQATLCLGRYPFEANTFFGGDIDLNKCYIKVNNVIVWQGVTEIQPPTSNYKLVKATERKYYKYKNVANGYRELSSLQTGEVTDSGIQCTTKVSFEYVAAMKSIGTYHYFLYNNNYALGTWMISGYETSTEGFSLHYKSQLYGTGVQPTVDKYHKFSTDFTTSSKKYYIDDSQKVTISDSSVQNLAGNILFGDSYWSAKYIKLFDENYNVIRFFKPCERISDNTYGWYDTVNDTFYPVSTIVEAGDYVAEEGTSSDYDFYEDVPVYKLKKIPGEIVYLKNFANPGNMTSNGTLGGNTFAVEGTAKSSGNDLYQLMGDNIDWTKQYQHRQNSGYITFYNPTPFKLEEFTIQVNGNAPSINCVMYGSNDNTNWTQVASRPTSSPTAVPDVWTINSPDFYKYYKYTYDATNYYSQGKTTIIYYLHVSGYTEGTAQDYDTVLYTTKYEAVHHYEEEQPWTQPVLTSDTSYGTISSSVKTFIDGPAWHISDGVKVGTSYWGATTASGSGDVTWALPEQIKMTSCKVYVTNQPARFPQSITIQGSNDGTNWTTVGSLTGYSQPSAGSYVTVTCDNPNFYSYYKWKFENSWHGSQVAVDEVEISATYHS